MKYYLMPRPFKVLSFDLDDTLYDNRPVIKKAKTELNDFLTQRFSAAREWQDADWQACKRIVLRSNPELAEDLSACRRAVLHRAIASWGYQGSQLIKAVDDAMDCFLFHRSNFSLSSEVLELLANLKRKHKLIAITNGNVDIKAIGLDSLMDHAFHPGNGLAMKPASDLFNLAARTLSVPLADITHIGDNWVSDVQGARQAGCNSIWLNPAINDVPKQKGTGQLPHIEISHLNELEDIFIH